MTKQQVQEKTKEKIEKIMKFLKELQVTYSAEEKITPDGYIKKVVLFSDNEEYKIDEETKNIPSPFAQNNPQ